MDQETLTNHITRLGKYYFDNACKLVLNQVFNLKAINVDGKNDGGTDFIALGDSGERTLVAYQITTQKTDIARKAYKDAEKSLRKLGINRFFYLTTFVLSETEARKIENQITSDLNIPSTCLSANLIAGLILSDGLLNQFLDENNYPLPRDYSPKSIDYREIALHSYTLLSSDASDLKEGIYDDTVLFILSNSGELSEDEIITQVKGFLGLNSIKEEILKKRIGALFGREKLKRNFNGNIILSEKSKNDIDSRKRVYEIELADIVSAQTDLMRNDYHIDWTVDDSKKISVWIAEAFIAQQISNLKEIKASIVSHPLFKVDDNSLDKIKEFLIKKKRVDIESVDKLIEDLLKLASNHPVITKITRASIYLALEGSNPVSSAKSLGGNRWSDFNIMVEPTVAIPYTCSQLYQGFVNRYFDMSVKSIKRAKRLGARLHIPYFYINECAGHLLQARKYDGIELDKNELQFSGNAFVANYYALKLQGARIPESFMDYLCSYSSSLKTERIDVKSWVRSLMTDLQSILNKSGIEFVQVPFYNHEDCANFEKEYLYQLNEIGIEKPSHLINHDIWGLQFTNDRITNNNEHWIILTYDRSLISFAKTDKYNGWVTNPSKFIDITESSKPLSETQFVSLLHSVATFSEKTLSAGARIMDRIINYASPEMQNWEFKRDIELFKKDLVSSINLNSPDYPIEVDKQTDSFLKSKGIDLKINEETDVEL
ncbi:MAG: hypothetical protein NT175_03435 [Bacteroidetes bacterium]|nr:hypothetical protein [Bacteroidota bacterium]